MQIYSASPVLRDKYRVGASSVTDMTSELSGLGVTGGFANLSLEIGLWGGVLAIRLGDLLKNLPFTTHSHRIWAMILSS